MTPEIRDRTTGDAMKCRCRLTKIILYHSSIFAGFTYENYQAVYSVYLLCVCPYLLCGNHVYPAALCNCVFLLALRAATWFTKPVISGQGYGISVLVCGIKKFMKCRKILESISFLLPITALIWIFPPQYAA